MTSMDASYYRARAEQEREAALYAASQPIADIHLELAKAYEALVRYPELRPDLKLVAA